MYDNWNISKILWKMVSISPCFLPFFADNNPTKSPPKRMENICGKIPFYFWLSTSLTVKKKQQTTKTSKAHQRRCPQPLCDKKRPIAPYLSTKSFWNAGRSYEVPCSILQRKVLLRDNCAKMSETSSKLQQSEHSAETWAWKIAKMTHYHNICLKPC